MFSVTVDDKEYKVDFLHVNPTQFDPSLYECGTDCLIYKDESKVGWGRTYIHPLDNGAYNKNVGRKMALYRALFQAFPGEDNKETRRKFWQAYYEARGGKW